MAIVTSYSENNIMGMAIQSCSTRRKGNQSIQVEWQFSYHYFFRRPWYGVQKHELRWKYKTKIIFYLDRQLFDIAAEISDKCWPNQNKSPCSCKNKDSFNFQVFHNSSKPIWNATANRTENGLLSGAASFLHLDDSVPTSFIGTIFEPQL